MFHGSALFAAALLLAACESKDDQTAGGSEGASTGDSSACPESGYTRVDAAEFVADPAAFVGQQVCVSGTFRENLEAGGCENGTAGCCTHHPVVETDEGDVAINLGGPCGGDCGEPCPFSEGLAVTVWGTAIEVFLDTSVPLPGIQVYGSDPET